MSIETCRLKKASWQDRDRPPSLSTVVPVCKEELLVPEFPPPSAAAVLDGSLRSPEILFVGDGGSDASARPSSICASETAGLHRSKSAATSARKRR
jgi:hypothetical protein